MAESNHRRLWSSERQIQQLGPYQMVSEPTPSTAESSTTSRSQSGLRMASDPIESLKILLQEFQADFKRQVSSIHDTVQNLESSLRFDSKKSELGRASFQDSKPSCLDLPFYDGSEDPTAWTKRADEYFAFHRTPIGHKVDTASCHLQGRALDWFWRFLASRPSVSWLDFVEELHSHFRSATVATREQIGFQVLSTVTTPPTVVLAAMPSFTADLESSSTSINVFGSNANVFAEISATQSMTTIEGATVFIQKKISPDAVDSMCMTCSASLMIFQTNRTNEDASRTNGSSYGVALKQTSDGFVSSIDQVPFSASCFSSSSAMEDTHSSSSETKNSGAPVSTSLRRTELIPKKCARAKSIKYVSPLKSGVSWPNQVSDFSPVKTLGRQSWNLQCKYYLTAAHVLPKVGLPHRESAVFRRRPPPEPPPIDQCLEALKTNAYCGSFSAFTFSFLFWVLCLFEEMPTRTMTFSFHILVFDGGNNIHADLEDKVFGEGEYC